MTVQVVEEFCPRLPGLHTRDDTNTGATKLTTAVAEVLLYLAVMVELPLLLTVVVVALNVAVVAPAVTVTDAGTLSVELVSVSVTLAPPVGAG